MSEDETYMGLDLQAVYWEAPSRLMVRSQK